MRPSSGAMTSALAPREVGQVGVRVVGLAVEDPLVGPEQVERGEDHARWRPRRPTSDAVRNEPRRMRNSPTKPLRPGRPIEVSIDDREDAGQDRRRLLEAVELGDLAGVAALVDHADEEEQRAGGDAVVDHLQDAALDALRGEGEGAEDDEAEVRDRRVGDEALEVSSAWWRRRRRRRCRSRRA